MTAAKQLYATLDSKRLGVNLETTEAPLQPFALARNQYQIRLERSQTNPYPRGLAGPEIDDVGESKRPPPTAKPTGKSEGGAKPLTFSSRFCGRSGPFKPPNSTIFGPASPGDRDKFGSFQKLSVCVSSLATWAPKRVWDRPGAGLISVGRGGLRSGLR